MNGERVDNLSNEDYHKNSAIGSTSIKHALKSMAHYKAYQEGKLDKTTKPMDIGTSAHSAILERDFSIYIKAPTSDGRTKKYKEFVEENAGRIVLTPNDYDTVKGMFEAFFHTPIAAKLLQKGLSEVSFFTKDEATGLQLKARTDYYVDEGDGFILDYKTSRAIEPHAFARAIYEYQYDISAAYYIDVVESCTGKKIADFFWIAQEKTAPYTVVIYRATSDLLARAREQIRNAKINIVKAIESNNYPRPDISDKVLDIDIPAWAINKELSNE